MRPRWAATLLLVVFLFSLASPRLGKTESLTAPEPLDQASRAERKIDGHPVVLDGQPILFVRRGIAGVSAEERAQTVTRRLQRIASDVSLSAENLRIQENAEDGSLYLRLGQDVLLTVTERDARAIRLSPRQAAELALAKVRAALERYRQDRKPGQLLRHGLYASVASAAALAIGLTLIQISGTVLPWLGRWIASHSQGVAIGKVQLISPAMVSRFVLQILQLIRVFLLLLVLFFWAAYILRLFPWTRAFGEQIISYFTASVELVLAAIGNYLPNLFILALIGAITYYFLRSIRPFFTAIERGNLAIPGFYPDWASPTYNILSLLSIAIAAILAFPYLPGFDSPAFRGISVFLGLLLSLGSTSAITNVIGGIILIYTRAFRIGDHIRVGDVIGDIIEKNFLAIRICTPTNEVITIPNASLLTNNVINFNISSRELNRHLVLQTDVSLGYDIPWRQAHASLIEAALATAHVLPEPAPFVLQTELADHAIHYQLNACTDDPNRMVFILAELHQNIQDRCNSNGIEILSPFYTSIRDDQQTPPLRIAMAASSPPPA